MNFVDSQNILLVFLKFFGIFPINFGGKFRKFKNHLYNAVVSVALIVGFSIVGVIEFDTAVVRSIEKDSFLLCLTGMTAVFSVILCFAIIKLHLLVKSDVQEKYFDMVRDLEITVRNHHFKNTRMNKIIKDLRKSTLRQECFLIIYYLLIEFFYVFISATDNIFLYMLDNLFYEIFNCFFVQILIFLKMNITFLRQIQNHLNQVLLNLQKNHHQYNVEDFIKIHHKIRQFLETLNKAFGFIFLMTFAAIYGSMIPEIYKSLLILIEFNSEISMRLLFYAVLNFIWAMFSYYHLGRFAFECDGLKDKVYFRIK
jgi:hypothetical protein